MKKENMMNTLETNEVQIPRLPEKQVYTPDEILFRNVSEDLVFSNAQVVVSRQNPITNEEELFLIESSDVFFWHLKFFTGATIERIATEEDENLPYFPFDLCEGQRFASITVTFNPSLQRDQLVKFLARHLSFFPSLSCKGEWDAGERDATDGALELAELVFKLVSVMHMESVPIKATKNEYSAVQMFLDGASRGGQYPAKIELELNFIKIVPYARVYSFLFERVSSEQWQLVIDYGELSYTCIPYKLHIEELGAKVVLVDSPSQS